MYYGDTWNTINNVEGWCAAGALRDGSGGGSSSCAASSDGRPVWRLCLLAPS
jgi:hypothetical protein